MTSTDDTNTDDTNPSGTNASGTSASGTSASGPTASDSDLAEKSGPFHDFSVPQDADLSTSAASNPEAAHDSGSGDESGSDS